MKATFLTFLCTLSVCLSFSQTDTVRLKKRPDERKVIVTDRPPQAAYFQLGGSGPILSVNYDRRFAKRLNGAGFTAGLGFWGASGVTAVSIPVSLNYLVGRKSDFFEVAAGATYLSASVVDIFENKNSSSVFYHVNLGYRHQPATGGFFFRGGVSPLFFNGGYVTSYYIGFGYGF